MFICVSHLFYPATWPIQWRFNDFLTEVIHVFTIGWAELSMARGQ